MTVSSARQAGSYLAPRSGFNGSFANCSIPPFLIPTAPGIATCLVTGRPGHHRIDRLKERGVEIGKGRHCILRGRKRSVFDRTNNGTVSRAALGRLLRDGAERTWPFPSATMPSWAETEKNPPETSHQKLQRDLHRYHTKSVTRQYHLSSRRSCR